MKNLNKFMLVLILTLFQIINGNVCMAEDDTNIAFGKTVTTNTSAATIQGIIDGNNTSAQSANAWVVQANASDGAWVNINLCGIYKVNKIKIYHGYSDGNNMMTDYNIYYSKSKSDTPKDTEYILLKSFTGLTKSDVINEINIPVSARHIKIVSNTSGSLIRIREAEIYGYETEGEVPAAELNASGFVQSGETVIFNAIVKKNDYEITKVRLYINSELICDGVTEDNESYTFEVPSLSDGEYSAFAEVLYGENKSVKSNTISFEARDLHADIILGFLSPQSDTINPGENFEISAKVTEQNGTVLDSLDVYIDDVLLKSFKRNNDNIYTALKKVNPGTYTLKIKAVAINGKSFEKEKMISVPVMQITDFSNITVSASSNGSDASSTPYAVIDGKTDAYTGIYKWYIKDNPDKAWLIINFPCEYEINKIEVYSGYTDKEPCDGAAELITDYSFSCVSEENEWNTINETIYKKEVSDLTAEDLSTAFEFDGVRTNKLKLSAGETCKAFRIREIKIYGYKVNRAPQVEVEAFQNNGVILDTMSININAAISDDGSIEKTGIYIDGEIYENEITDDNGEYSSEIGAGKLENGKHTVNIYAVDDYDEIGIGIEQVINIVSEKELLNILSKATRENFVSEFTYITKYLNINTDELNSLSNSAKQEVYASLIGKTFNNTVELSSDVAKAVKDAKTPVPSVPTYGGGGGGGGNSHGSSTVHAAPVINNQPDKDSLIINTSDSFFDDIEAVSWAKQAINSLYSNSVISGTENGKFSPLENVTRGQFVKMLTGAFKITGSKNTVYFNDTDSTSVYYEYIMTAAAVGITDGYSDGGFHENDFITREAMAVMLDRALNCVGMELNSDKDIPFTDKISDYALGSVTRLCAAGIMNGVSDNIFASQDFANRAMAAKVIYEAGLLINNQNS